ncbi:helix-turn-helix domain-containing protein [uncultured Campylobacter sp.]|uniref:helix-turn-helix domain-containing protein n=1 Tax=uncultured Campylobacter sp. TaxID=218934 RepID=UPI0026262F39|nr:helix-turn-helix domain-containing protein [uncultured Campylobacter sp.]
MSEVSEILTRARFFAGVKTDAELSTLLKIPYGTLIGWKTRKNIPESRIAQMALILGIRRDTLIPANKEIEIPHSCEGCCGSCNNKPSNKTKAPKEPELKVSKHYVLLSTLSTPAQRAEAVRLDNSLKLGEFCELLHTSRHLYNRAKDGQYPFLLEWAYSLKENLHVNIDWLKSGVGPIYEIEFTEDMKIL